MYYLFVCAKWGGDLELIVVFAYIKLGNIGVGVTINKTTYSDFTQRTDIAKFGSPRLFMANELLIL